MTSSYHITSFHIISYHVKSLHIKSYHIVSYQIISYQIISNHIISYYIISYHIISYQIISYHIISYHIISYHIIIASYHHPSYHHIIISSYHPIILSSYHPIFISTYHRIILSSYHPIILSSYHPIISISISISIIIIIIVITIIIIIIIITSLSFSFSFLYSATRWFAKTIYGSVKNLKVSSSKTAYFCRFCWCMQIFFMQLVKTNLPNRVWKEEPCSWRSVFDIKLSAVEVFFQLPNWSFFNTISISKFLWFGLSLQSSKRNLSDGYLAFKAACVMDEAFERLRNLLRTFKGQKSFGRSFETNVLPNFEKQTFLAQLLKPNFLDGASRRFAFFETLLKSARRLQREMFWIEF